MSVENRIPDPPESYDEVVLDELSTAELLRERADIMARIPMIAEQLRDHTRRPVGPEDDSPEWTEYRDWRRRARWALAHHKRELVEVKAVLSERKDVGTVGNLLEQARRRAEIEQGKREPSEHDLLNVERARRISEALASATAEGMLLRGYRVLRHLLADYVNTLPDALDDADRQALFMIGTYLRRQYGSGRVAAFVDGDGGDS